MPSTIQKPFSAAGRQMGRHPLDAIFLPKSVAVVGATEKPNSVGRT
jgi:acetyltransferase